MPVFVVPLTYVEPHKAHVVQGRRKLQRCPIERDRQHPVRACASRRVLAEEIVDQMSPFVGDRSVARSRSPRHSFIDQDHDDFALGVQVNRRGRSAVRLPRNAQNASALPGREAAEGNELTTILFTGTAHESQK